MPAEDLLPLLASFMALCVCVALLWAYQNTLGAVLSTIANALHGVSFLGHHPLDFLANEIHALDSTINAYLVQAVDGTKYAWAKVLQFHALLWHDFTEAVGDLAGATQHWINNVSPRTITRIAAGVFAPYLGLLHWLSHEVGHLAALPAKVVTEVTHAVTVEVPKVITKVERVSNTVVKTVTVTLPRTIPATFPRVGTLERDISALEKWVRSHTKDLGLAAVSGLLVAALARELPWARCKNTSNVAKKLCSVPIKALEDLLGGVLDFLVLTDLCVLFTLMDKLATAVEPLILTATNELDHFLSCRHSRTAPELTPAYIGAPTPSGTITF